jgi:hypothetical protein
MERLGLDDRIGTTLGAGHRSEHQGCRKGDGYAVGHASKITPGGGRAAPLLAPGWPLLQNGTRPRGRSAAAQLFGQPSNAVREVYPRTGFPEGGRHQSQALLAPLATFSFAILAQVSLGSTGERKSLATMWPGLNLAEREVCAGTRFPSGGSFKDKPCSLCSRSFSCPALAQASLGSVGE